MRIDDLTKKLDVSSILIYDDKSPLYLGEIERHNEFERVKCSIRAISGRDPKEIQDLIESIYYEKETLLTRKSISDMILLSLLNGLTFEEIQNLHSWNIDICTWSRINQLSYDKGQWKLTKEIREIRRSKLNQLLNIFKRIKRWIHRKKWEKWA